MGSTPVGGATEPRTTQALDGFNGGGDPRTINMGPTLRSEGDYEDIKSKPGTPILVMGYGSY